MWTILKLIEWTADYFKKHGVPNPRLDAELLLSHLLNKKRIELYLCFEQVVSEKDLATFKGYVQRRVKREPLQYITGVQEFYGIPIKVTTAVLIPRPETELLVEKALLLVAGRSSLETSNQQPATILDLCTGSGAIIAAMASRLTSARLIGTDISAAALEIARINTEEWKERIELLEGDLFAPLSCKESVKKFDIIISNPPYVAKSELATLQPEVRDHEPRTAIIAAEDGLAIIGRIINDAPAHLNDGGRLIMEIGDGQSDRVRQMMIDKGAYGDVGIIKDYSGIERIIWTSLS